jgi:hypothetical protein
LPTPTESATAKAPAKAPAPASASAAPATIATTALSTLSALVAWSLRSVAAGDLALVTIERPLPRKRIVPSYGLRAVGCLLLTMHLERQEYQQRDAHWRNHVLRHSNY